MSLAVASNGRYLTAGGVPFLLHGYVAWSLMALSRANATIFLDNVAAKGITALIVTIPDYFATALTDSAGNLPFTGTVSGVPDFTTPNAAYWANADWLFAACRARGIVVFVAHAYYGFPGSHEGWGVDNVLNLNGSTRLTTYGAFLGTRYASQPNIVWVNFADNLPVSGERTLVKAIQDGIKSTDVAGRLHTNHFERGSLSTDDATVPCDINWAYSAGGSTSPRVHKKVLDGYAVAGPKPVFLGEDYYDHRTTPISSQQLRQENWDAWLSGACGKFFGDSYVWPFDSAWGSLEHWYDHLEDTGISQLTHLRKFMLERQWHLLVPNTGTGLVTSGGGTVDTDGYKPRALSSDSRWGAVYVSDGSLTTIDKSLFSAAFTARWYDPSNGSYTAIGAGIANSGTQAYSTPGTNAAGGTDWVWVGDVP